MHKRMVKSVKVVSELELDSVSPKLLNVKNLSIAVPGTYSPEKRFDVVESEREGEA
jgi:singapore isolate B (sub-type 7) whole genome shotgun sequence assembly, scaffold_5